ncbi:MAG: terminase small subunit [Peptococcales bacterium]|jgi:phage terminase small subunit
MVELSPKQKRFVHEYLIDLNATQAAIRAGYSERTAKSIGQRLLTYVDVQAAIQEAMKKREKRTEITQDKVLKELAKLAFADIKDFLSFRTEKTIVDHDKETGEPIIDYAHVVELKDSDQVDGSLISEVQLKNGELKFKLHDKVKALEMCGRHLGMFKDKAEVELTIKKLEDFMK